MHCTLKRAPGLYLAGFMGSGKTTVGRALAERIGWDFVDVDAEVEAREHLTVAEIFTARGEPEFRRLETETIREWTRRIERGNPAVIALGGGAFVQPESYRLLENRGVSIWLDCPFDTIEKRIGGETATRPLARDREALRRLHEERRAGYSRADYRVDTDCDVERALQLILELPIWK